MFLEIIKFIIYSLLIVVIAKYLLVRVLRSLAESLELNPKTIGNITGIATSIPELLTVIFSAITGFLNTSIFNILSSNVINLIQYGGAIGLNKNQKYLRNKAIIIDLILCGITILIPAAIVGFQIEVNLFFVPIFLFLAIIFYKINTNSHKLYLEKEEKSIEQEELEEIQREEKRIGTKTIVVLKYAFFLIIIGIILYFVGDKLSIALENLCNQFGVPEFVLGILLGFATSLPELITFFESQKHYREVENKFLGVVESTNNLLTSNILNLFIIQSIGILLYLL